MRASAKDLRFHSREILNAVSRGEEVIITFRGRPRAKIVPLKDASTSKKRVPGGSSVCGKIIPKRPTLTAMFES